MCNFVLPHLLNKYNFEIWNHGVVDQSGNFKNNNNNNIGVKGQG